MSLINCPECGNECSSTAPLCPKCGYAFAVPVAEPQVFVEEVPREKPFPSWIFIPLAILGAALLVFLFVIMSRDDESAQRNINVNLAAAGRQPGRAESNISRTDAQPNEIVIPSAPPEFTQIPAAPQSVQPQTGTQSTTIVPVSTPNDKGLISLEAKLATRSGGTQPVPREKFYLLDKDLQSILLEAGINDEEGLGLTNAFGVSVVNPSKYRETNQKALAAIKRHIVYSTTTDSSGKAQIKEIKPDSYYLFAITKTPRGFAIWDALVSVQAGQNSLVLPPMTPTEIVEER